MKRKKVYLALAFVAIIVGLAVALPLKAHLERQLVGFLQAQGIEGAAVHIARVGLHEAVLEDIALGADGLFSINRVTINYSLDDLRRLRPGALQVKDVMIRAGRMQFHADEGSFAADTDGSASNWRGSWTLSGVTIEGGPEGIPPLEGEGKLSVAQDNVNLQGTFADAEDNYRAEFAFTRPGDILRISFARIPWQGGEVSLKDTDVALRDATDYRLILHVKRVALSGLLKAATGDRADATGTVSGSVPLVIEKDGSIAPGIGVLSADGGGVISLSPDALPGDAAQMGLVRDVLKNFHYSSLSLSTGGVADGKPTLALTLEGNNPEVYGGRAVKLNVNLSGDVLDFLRHNVTLLTDPSSTLR